MTENNTVLAPDCGRSGCTQPARFQYEEVDEGASAYQTKIKERCKDHQLELFDDRGRTFEYREVLQVYGKYEEKVETPWWWPFEKTETKWAELEMDPHYFCKRNKEEYCVDGYRKSCPLNITIRIER